MKKKLMAIFMVASVALMGGCVVDSSSSGRDLTFDQAVEELNAQFSSGHVRYKTVQHEPDSSWVGVEDPYLELPAIEQKYPLSVIGDAALNVEIFSSTEKSSASTDRWMEVMAKEFNNSNQTVNGHRVSVSVRPIASGLALDYITTGVYVPEAYSPANELWAAMIASRGVQVTEVQKKLTGNTAGILMKQSAYNDFVSKYGEVTIENVVVAVQAGDLRLGHTNPNASSTGLNILTQELLAFDPSNPLSQTATDAFRGFQSFVPPTSPTTAEMAKVAARGSIDAMTMEAQAYMVEPTLQTGWVFVPMGVRHDSPLYGLGAITPDQQQVLRLFADWCLKPASQARASEFHFNQHDGYVYKGKVLDGAQLYGALDTWKQNKDAGQPILSVWVFDKSGSMAGDPLNRSKLASIRSIPSINQSNFVGMVSYSDESNVNIDLPIAQFDNQQQDLFAGAVRDLKDGGGTATNDAILVAAKMLLEAQQSVPGAKLRIVVLSDGEQNRGVGINKTLDIIKGLGISVYGVGFNADLTDLQKLADLNEGGYTINADNVDVVSQLRGLFQVAL